MYKYTLNTHFLPQRAVPTKSTLFCDWFHASLVLH